MTGNIRSLRPARTAIAAVLVLTSPALLAQTEVPPAEPTVAVPQSPPAPTFAPAQPVVQPTPSVAERLDAAIAASETAAASEPVAAKRVAPKPVAKTVARPSAPPPVRIEAPVQREVTPPPSTLAVETVAPAEPSAIAPAPAPAPAPAAATATDPALLWALGGGALLAIGLAGTALLRRRKPEDEIWIEEAVEPAQPIARVAPPTPAMPLMTLPPDRAPLAAPGSDERILEAMVAAPPSPENPFRTHAKRMTRAKFLLAQQRGPAEASPAALTRAPDSPLPTSTQTVYRFGSDRRRDSAFKPRTS